MSNVTRRRFLGTAAGSTVLAVLKPSELFAVEEKSTMLPILDS